MKSLIRKWLRGEAVFSAYAKITTSDKLQQKAWLKKDGLLQEVSSTHFLLCIEPIVFGIWLPSDKIFGHVDMGDKFLIYIGGKNIEKDIQHPEVKLFVQASGIVNESAGLLLLLKLEESRIHQLNVIKRHLLYYRYYKDSAMPYSRFKSFVSAYSYPRRIKVVCFKQDDYYNIFPMDLLGDIHQHGRYVFGLRHTNVALQKIISSRKLVVCEVPCHYKDTVYELGKHHSGNPPSLESLDFKTIPSRHFGFEVPSWADSYKEVTIEKTLNLGSHMLLWGQCLEETVLRKPSQHLYLVHFLHYLHHQKFFNDYTLV